MNWDAIGAVGEVAGAVGVIATLVYLAAQIRANTTESKLTAVHEISDTYTRFMLQVSSDSELAMVWDKGLHDFESLNRNERVRFLILAAVMFRVLDDAYIQYASGRMDEDAWHAYEKVVELVASTKGMREYAARRLHTHSMAFADHFNKKVEQSKGLHDVYEFPASV